MDRRRVKNRGGSVRRGRAVRTLERKAAKILVKRTVEQLRRDALTIWRAGLQAVQSEPLVRHSIHCEDQRLVFGDTSIDLSRTRRIVVVGAGKAGAGMAAAVEQTLGESLMSEKQLTGWVNVPADCVRPLMRIHLHPARPAGVNEPTASGAEGAREILRLVRSLGADDLCIALISGGGSALMPLPIEGVSLDDKLAVTRFLSAAGAPIEELNAVRKQLSQIKGGNLARACAAGRLVTLIISDVLGDPLDVIASGPTVEDPSTAEAAIEILDRYGARSAGISKRVFDALQSRHHDPVQPIRCHVSNLVIGNNEVAVNAARLEAERLGYTPRVESAKSSEGPAEDVGHNLALVAEQMRVGDGPDCLIGGGEPTVRLVEPAQRGLGGRNQQLVLAAVERLADGASGILILSGGTDGEDGPTDAAGAWADADIIEDAKRRHLDPADYLRRNDAYHWFDPLGSLIKTGPTHTNVCDLRIVLVDRQERALPNHKRP
jgi:glycerate 2-kinase